MEPYRILVEDDEYALRQPLAPHSRTAIIALSAPDHEHLAVRAMKQSATDYMVMPIEFSSALSTLDCVIATPRELCERANSLADLEMALRQQSGALRAALARLEGTAEDSLELLAAALDARERETQAHSKRVSDYSVHLARELGVAEPELEIIRQGAMLHDIGKIAIPDRILLKPDHLTPAEWVEMRKHPEIGAWILSEVASLQQASDIVISHHERFDGTGYPHGLEGERIPLGARIFAVADTLDAMISDRPYRASRTYPQARAEIAKGARTQFDPLVTEGFLRIPETAWTAIREHSFQPGHGIEGAP